MNIRSDLTWSFTLEIAVLLTALGVVAYWGSRSIIETQVSEAAVVGLTQTDRNLATIVGGASDLSLFLISNRNMRQLLASPGPDRGLPQDQLATLTEDLANLAGSKAAVLSINVYGDNGLQYETAGPSVVREGQLPGGWESRVPLDGTAVLTPTYKRDYQTLGPRNVISFCRRLIDVNHLTRGLGLIRIDLAEDAVAALYKGASLGQTGAVFITDGRGRVISHADKVLLGQDLSQDPVFADVFTRPGDGYGRVKSAGVELLVASHRSPARDQVFVSVVPFRELTQSADRAGLLLLAVLSAALVLAFLVVRAIAQRITDPIPALIARMRLVEEGDLDARVAVKSKNELGTLGDSFNRMTGKLKTLIDEVYTSQIVRREAELKALQAQINPHFLYNTLDVIYWTARMENAPKTAEVVQALAKLFKLGLNHGEEFTTVGREVEHLASYLVIQRVRFDHPPEVTVDVDPGLFPCVTPKLLLQPLVENAFVHGIADLDRPAWIKVTGRGETRDGEVIVFCVEDNGVGMTDQRRVQVLSSDVGARDSYGIKNVDESLKLFFGREFGLSIESSLGRGTKVTLVLPRTTVRPPEALR